MNIVIGMACLMIPFMGIAYAIGKAMGRDRMLPIKRALLVMVLDKNISAYLRENDPKALEQATKAIKDDDAKCSDAHGQPDVYVGRASDSFRED